MISFRICSVYCLRLIVLGNLINKGEERSTRCLNGSKGNDGKVRVVGVGIDVDLLDLLGGERKERTLSGDGSMGNGTSLHSVEFKELSIDLCEADKVVVHLALFDLGLALLHSFVVDLADLPVEC